MGEFRLNYIEIEPKGKIYYHGNGVNINFIYFHEEQGLQGFFWDAGMDNWYQTSYKNHASKGHGCSMKQFVDKSGKIAYALRT